MSDKQIAIEYKNVKKRFSNSGAYAVDDVSLKVEAGSIVTILGTSGSGKTTLLKLTNRLLELTSGSIEYFGEDILSLPVNEYRRKLGYVIQQAGLFPHRTVQENIATVPRLLGMDKAEIDRRVDEFLNMVNLPPEEYRKRYPRQLSGGQQQRVGLARALVSNPSLVLMDEPFGAIDAITRNTLQGELISLQAELKNTILFVTHDIQEALKLGHKVIVMDGGKVQQYDTPTNIVLHPANDYVRRLVSTEDFYDKLRVLYVKDHVVPATEDEIREGIRISKKSYLSEALGVLLQRKKEYVIVEDAEGNPIGKIELESLRRMTE